LEKFLGGKEKNPYCEYSWDKEIDLEYTSTRYLPAFLAKKHLSLLIANASIPFYVLHNERLCFTLV
jgi:hypothetical protein